MGIALAGLIGLGLAVGTMWHAWRATQNIYLDQRKTESFEEFVQRVNTQPQEKSDGQR